MDIPKEEINELYKESVENGYSKRMQEFFIKLGANTRSVYDLITMGANQVTDLLLEEIESKNPDLELIKDILEYSVIDVNSKNSVGQTALMRAADNGKEKAVELLLNHPGIDVNLQDRYGWTALIWAAYNGREKAVELLLNHPKIDVNVQDKSGCTALMWGARWGKEKCVKLLLNYPGIDVTLKNEHNQTAWEKAKVCIRNGFPKLNPNA
jgi:ankyrin repeat protein